MSLLIDGKAAMAAMLRAPETFRRIKDSDWSLSARQLAKKQLIAGRQKVADIAAIRDALGDDIFDKTLESLTANQARQLAARLDKEKTQQDFKSGSEAVAHVRDLLEGKVRLRKDKPKGERTREPETADAGQPTRRYLGRKAFRTGR